MTWLLFGAQVALGGSDYCPDVPEADICDSNIAQDLNCNGIESSNEQAVDLADPLCLQQTDAAGIPWPNADYYVEYESFGCAYPTDRKSVV